MFVAVRDRSLRDAYALATTEDPRLWLIAASDDVDDIRLHERRPDLVVVAGGELSAQGVSTGAWARDLYPDALVLPVSQDDEPGRLLDRAVATLAEP